jgi:hypothetical protein
MLIACLRFPLYHEISNCRRSPVLGAYNLKPLPTFSTYLLCYPLLYFGICVSLLLVEIIHNIWGFVSLMQTSNIRHQT